MSKEVRIYASFSNSSDGGCSVRTLVPLLHTICLFVTQGGLISFGKETRRKLEFLFSPPNIISFRHGVIDSPFCRESQVCQCRFHTQSKEEGDQRKHSATFITGVREGGINSYLLAHMKLFFLYYIIGNIFYLFIYFYYLGFS